MEDFSNILWIVLVVASIAVSFFSKQKEQQKGSTPEINDAEPDSLPEPTAPTARQPMVLRKHPPASNSKQNASTALHNTFAQQADTAEEGESEAAATNAYEYTEAEVEPPQTEGTAESIAADFNLQKAVIWSEILKPKFDEESL